ncbi:MAG: Cytochrome c-type biogenesis protein CcmE, heme chaperone [uncultured Caballeronia sp.]|nr:MAG: Cytochrome c-type biogenesis protein CcmE, heme chaperone [uncultured Caballeronia sp.]
MLNAFNANVMFFVTPTQLISVNMKHAARLRVGGLVARGSIERDASGLTVRFMITDTVREIPVLYRGVLPDLFREGKGVVAQGRLLPDGVFLADQVLAKQDENYMPPDAAEAIKRARSTLRVPDSVRAPAGVDRRVVARYHDRRVAACRRCSRDYWLDAKRLAACESPMRVRHDGIRLSGGFVHRQRFLSRWRMSPRIPIRCCRSSTALRPSGVVMKVHCCSGILLLTW